MSDINEIKRQEMNDFIAAKGDGSKRQACMHRGEYKNCTICTQYEGEDRRMRLYNHFITRPRTTGFESL